MPSNKIRCIILEDEAPMRHLLEQYLQTFPELEIVGSTDTAGQALELCRQFRPQAAFMDIVLKDATAFYLLDMLRKEALAIPKIVLVSGHSEYALESLNRYRNEVVKFITKPFMHRWKKKFQEAIDALQLELAEPVPEPQQEYKPSFIIKEKNQEAYHHIHFEDLAWIEAEAGDSCFFTDDNMGVISAITLKRFLDAHPMAPLCRISNNVAVNKRRISRIDSGQREVAIRYRDGEKHFDIGGAYYRSFFTCLEK